jgi:hypothetical protein
MSEKKGQQEDWQHTGFLRSFSRNKSLSVFDRLLLVDARELWDGRLSCTLHRSSDDVSAHLSGDQPNDQIDHRWLVCAC